jgi:hypothetical protein
MKHLILFYFILQSIICSGQIKIIPSIELGYINRIPSMQKTILVDDVLKTSSFFYYDLKNSMFSNIALQGEWKSFTFFVANETYFKPKTMFSYKPNQIEYIIGGSYKYNVFEFKASHMCSHSIDRRKFNDGYNRISVKINLVNK